MDLLIQFEYAVTACMIATLVFVLLAASFLSVHVRDWLRQKRHYGVATFEAHLHLGASHLGMCACIITFWLCYGIDHSNLSLTALTSSVVLFVGAWIWGIVSFKLQQKKRSDNHHPINLVRY